MSGATVKLRKWLIRGVIAAAVIYLMAAGFVAYAVTRPPEQFGQIMKHLPVPVVFAVLPGRQMYMWARDGRLDPGEMAPDFTLPTQDRSDSVTLSSFRGRRPVVLVFGSYT